MSASAPAIDLRLLAALAEPTRLRMVELLRGGPLSVGAIAARLGLRQPQASKHLRVLQHDGVLEKRADANRRIYALRAEPFRSLDRWASSFQAITEQRFDQLDIYLKKLQAKDGRKLRRRR